MSNRDQEGPRYGRSEGRDGDDWRDQSNRGSRDWDRGGDDFRAQNSQSYGRRDERQGHTGSGYTGSGYTGSSYGDDERSLQQRYPVSNWRDEHTFAQRDDRSFAQRDDRAFAQRSPRDWNRSVYQQPDQSGFSRDWGHSRNVYGGERDYGREQGQSYRSQYGRDEGFGAQTYPDSPYFGPRREEWDPRNATVGRFEWQGGYRRQSGGEARHHDENWGQQLREGVQHMADRVKRAFRGPKNYKRSDERIREDVSDRLAHQYDVDPTDIEVSVSSGEVTLTGTVQSRREKFLAEEIADDVGGVTEVHNQLRVRRESQTQTLSGTTQVTSGAGAGNGNRDTHTSSSERGRA